ncbi:hypothetical protein N665_1022s0001 [Sinapis alba]|nr:hypothetical protein N665_1022s0001 [Sinapis alba]
MRGFFSVCELFNSYAHSYSENQSCQLSVEEITANVLGLLSLMGLSVYMNILGVNYV